MELQICFSGGISNKVPDVVNGIIGYLFGACATYSLITVAKFTVGRLRPHFLDICRPKFEKLLCGLLIMKLSNEGELNMA